MDDTCIKCGTKRVLLLTSYVCDCPKAPSKGYQEGQLLTTVDEINGALAAGLYAKATFGQSIKWRRVRDGVLQGWDYPSVRWQNYRRMPFPYSGWNFEFEWTAHRERPKEAPP